MDPPVMWKKWANKKGFVSWKVWDKQHAMQWNTSHDQYDKVSICGMTEKIEKQFLWYAK